MLCERQGNELRVLAKRFARPEFYHNAVARDWSSSKLEAGTKWARGAGARAADQSEPGKPLLYYGVPTRGSPYDPTEYSDSEVKYYQLLWQGEGPDRKRFVLPDLPADHCSDNHAPHQLFAVTRAGSNSKLQLQCGQCGVYKTQGSRGAFSQRAVPQYLSEPIQKCDYTCFDPRRASCNKCLALFDAGHTSGRDKRLEGKAKYARLSRSVKSSVGGSTRTGGTTSTVDIGRNAVPSKRLLKAQQKAAAAEAQWDKEALAAATKLAKEDAVRHRAELSQRAKLTVRCRCVARAASSKPSRSLLAVMPELATGSGRASDQSGSYRYYVAGASIHYEKDTIVSMIDRIATDIAMVTCGTSRILEATSTYRGRVYVVSLDSAHTALEERERFQRNVATNEWEVNPVSLSYLFGVIGGMGLPAENEVQNLEYKTTRSLWMKSSNAPGQFHAYSRVYDTQPYNGHSVRVVGCCLYITLDLARVLCALNREAQGSNKQVAAAATQDLEYLVYLILEQLQLFRHGAGVYTQRAYLVSKPGKFVQQADYHATFKVYGKGKNFGLVVPTSPGKAPLWFSPQFLAFADSGVTVRDGSGPKASWLRTVRAQYSTVSKGKHHWAQDPEFKVFAAASVAAVEAGGVELLREHACVDNSGLVPPVIVNRQSEAAQLPVYQPAIVVDWDDDIAMAVLNDMALASDGESQCSTVDAEYFVGLHREKAAAARIEQQQLAVAQLESKKAINRDWYQRQVAPLYQMKKEMNQWFNYTWNFNQVNFTQQPVQERYSSLPTYTAHVRGCPQGCWNCLRHQDLTGKLRSGASDFEPRLALIRAASRAAPRPASTKDQFPRHLRYRKQVQGRSQHDKSRR